MFDVKVLGAGVTAAVTLLGYYYMTRRDRERRRLREDALLQAMEEMKQNFARERSMWQETRDEMIEKLLSQERTIECLEVERRRAESKLLEMEKLLLEEVEAEERRGQQVSAAFEEARRADRLERDEERLRLMAETEALSRRLASAERRNEELADEMKTRDGKASRMESQIKELEEERRGGQKSNRWEERLIIIREKNSLSQTFVSSGEQKSEGTTKAEACRRDTTTENKVRTMEEKTQYVLLESTSSWTNRCTPSGVRQLTLDPNTAHSYFVLSENDKKVTRVTESQSYPDNPERFDFCSQVLCRESLTGRCYWEVEWRGGVSIAVAYRGISRRGFGNECLFGLNDKSVSLACYDGPHGSWYTVLHNATKTPLSVRPSGSNKVGAYVDWPAGTLSFYRVSSDTKKTHLYTFRSTFTEPLYPGFFIGEGSSACLRQVEEVR